MEGKTMLTRKSLARTAAATAGLALVATGALAPVAAAEGKGSERGQSQAAAAQAKAADRKSADADRKAENADRKPAQTDRSKGRSADAPHGHAYGHAEDKDAKAAPQSEARGPKAKGGDKSNNGLGDERGNGHTPVTVCHATGNGGFVEITFDENALEKHLENHMKHMEGHQDYVVEEGAGCDAVAPAATEDGVDEDAVVTDDSTTTKTVAGTETMTRTRETVAADVLGVEAFAARTGTGVEAPAAQGAEAAVAGTAAAPATGPVAGILPQTGAAPMALAAAAGLGLLGAGATMVARRRREV
jgi:LPXTG-motif cell wall-anchored protein